jgi:hypothetical protein
VRSVDRALSQDDGGAPGNHVMRKIVPIHPLPTNGDEAVARLDFTGVGGEAAYVRTRAMGSPAEEGSEFVNGERGQLAPPTIALSHRKMPITDLDRALSEPEMPIFLLDRAISARKMPISLRKKALFLRKIAMFLGKHAMLQGKKGMFSDLREDSE